MIETETKWSERVREWRASGRTAKEYAEGREFKAHPLAGDQCKPLTDSSAGLR